MYADQKIKEAYDFLEKNNQLKIIDGIKTEIEKKEISYKFNPIPEFKVKINNNENFIKTLNQILHLNLELSLFSAQLAISLHKNKTFFFPLPKEWLDILHNKGIKINYNFSKLLFLFSSISYFVVDFVRIIFLSFSKNVNFNKKNTIIFLPEFENINFQKEYLDKKYNYLYWIKNYLNIKNKIIFVHNNKKILNKNFDELEIKYVKFFLLNNLKINERFLFIFYVLQTFYHNLAHIIKGNFYFLYSLQNYYFAYCTLKFESKAPNFVFYSNSNCLVRPWWTFLVENKNDKKVYTAYYSTNHFPFYSYENPFAGARLMTWYNYIFWTRDQMLWLEKINHNFKEYSLVGYFPFFGKNVQFPKNKRIVSIFPVIPYEKKFLYHEFTSRHYYKPDISIKFLKDIILSLKDYDVDIYIKLKRDNLSLDNECVKFINKLNNDKNIKLINSDVSVISLIDQSDIVVSSPYSSPSLVADYHNKPSIFYDSSGSLEILEPSMKKIRLIKKIDELKNWFKNMLN